MSRGTTVPLSQSENTFLQWLWTSDVNNSAENLKPEGTPISTNQYTYPAFMASPTPPHPHTPTPPHPHTHTRHRTPTHHIPSHSYVCLFWGRGVGYAIYSYPPLTHAFLKWPFLTDFKKYTHTPPYGTKFWCSGRKMEKTLRIHEFAPRWHVMNVPERYVDTDTWTELHFVEMSEMVVGKNLGAVPLHPTSSVQGVGAHTMAWASNLVRLV